MYDLAIIWAWSAGLPAWIYASRYKIKNIIIWEMLGWALTQSHLIENYPWVPHVSWSELMNNFLNHAKEAWSEILNDRVSSVIKEWEKFTLSTIWWKEIIAKYVLIAIWNRYRRLWLEEEANFVGRWVSYCATCDGMFYRWRDVAIAGWWNTALTEAIFLAEICNKVHLVHRREEFRAEKVLIEKAKEHKNIEFHTSVKIEKIEWSLYVENIKLNNWENLKVDWLFVAIWNEPDTSLFDKMWVELDMDWYIQVDKTQKTSVDWLYAAWDITTNSNKFKQTLIAAAEWALAAASIHEEMIKDW